MPLTDLAVAEFIEEARGVSIAEAAARLGLKFTRGRAAEQPGPCPVDGGRDTFSFNTQKNLWNCRAGGCGGHDAIGLAAHVRGLDVRRRDGFLQACAEVTDRAVPDGGERESDADRAARLARLEAARMRAYEEMAARDAGNADFRERERAKARGIVEAAMPISSLPTGPAHLYIRARGAMTPPEGRGWLRHAADQPYWHGDDGSGRSALLHSGPAMVAAIVDASLAVVGCHITWIDLARRPKFRPELFDPATGESLPTKKMRGTKKGGLIPLCGDPSARRWVGGEGIENGLAFGTWEGYRADTFYFAAGDLGNLSGPAEPASRFPHPTLKKPDRNGVMRSVMIAGPVPKRGQDDDEAMWVGAHVDELVLLGDGDSERVMTAAAMARARARHARPEGQTRRLIPIVWPKGGPGAGYDFAKMAVEEA